MDACRVRSDLTAGPGAQFGRLAVNQPLARYFPDFDLLAPPDFLPAVIIAPHATPTPKNP